MFSAFYDVPNPPNIVLVEGLGSAGVDDPNIYPAGAEEVPPNRLLVGLGISYFVFASYIAFYPNNEFPSGLADAVVPNKFVLVAGEVAGADYSLGFPPNKPVRPVLVGLEGKPKTIGSFFSSGLVSAFGPPNKPDATGFEGSPKDRVLLITGAVLPNTLVDDSFLGLELLKKERPPLEGVSAGALTPNNAC